MSSKKNEKYLFINTVNVKLPSFSIFNNEGDVLSKSVFYIKIESLVRGLKIFLDKNNLSGKDITAVLVINGPGSFTSTRAGIVLGNSFNFLYNISVLGIKDNTEKLEAILKKNSKTLSKLKKIIRAKVYYNKEPSITNK